MSKGLTLFFLMALTTSLYANVKSCEKEGLLAAFLEDISSFDYLHNCSINVSYEKEKIFINNKLKNFNKYKVLIRDDHYCSFKESDCFYNFFEFKIPQDCLQKETGNNQKKKGNFIYQDRFKFKNYFIHKMAIIQYDFFGNLIRFEIGEKSNLSEKNHRIVCRPYIWGD